MKNNYEDDKDIIKEKDDYTFAKAFIFPAKERSFSTESLKNILDEVKHNKFYGDIKWPEVHKNSELVDKIESQLKANNNEFTRFPSDSIHAQMSKHVYKEDLTEKHIVYFKFSSSHYEPWRVKRIFEIKTSIIGKGKRSEVVVYAAVLYMNESRKQLVLATKGIEASIFKSHISSHDALTNSLKGILCDETIPQLYQVSERLQGGTERLLKLG